MEIRSSRAPIWWGGSAGSNYTSGDRHRPAGRVVRLGTTTFYQRTRRKLRLTDPAELDGLVWTAAPS